MAEFALFINDVFTEIRRYNSQPDDIPHKGVVWLPVVRKDIDNSTQKYRQSNITQEVANNSYEIVTTISDLPQAEIDVIVEAEKDRAISVIDTIDVNYLKALGMVVFELVNQVRVLQGNNTITAQQFKNYVRGKL